jgi:hypothetical protein
MAIHEHDKKTHAPHPQWSDALQAPASERIDPRLRTLSAIESAVLSCAEGLARAFGNLKEAQISPLESENHLRGAIHALNESLNALKPIQRLTATSPDQMRELFTCISDTARELSGLLDKTRAVLLMPPEANRVGKVQELIHACPHITHGLENSLVIPLKVTKQEMLDGNNHPQSLIA